jgi:hypothetical protein
MKKEGEEKDNLPSQQYEDFFMNFQVNVNFKCIGMLVKDEISLLGE